MGRKVIFLDRDGVLIYERGDYNYRPSEIEIVHGCAEALAELGSRGYHFIVITNQGGIQRGLYTHKRVKDIHQDLKGFFASFGADILDFYYCPHHPTVSNCLCRKPDSLMLEKACARFSADKEASYFIGDNERDIEAGKKAGIKTILIPSNSDLRDYLQMIE